MARAHLNGSLNLESTEEVFQTVSEIGGDSLKRIPDGETGARRAWIMTQESRLEANPNLEKAPAAPGGYEGEAALDSYRLKSGVKLEDLVFDLGYADAAAASYKVFQRMKKDGTIASAARFQVSLPTRMALVMRWISPEQHELMSPVLDEALHTEAVRVSEIVPHDELAIQWDVAIEFMSLEGLGSVVDPQAIYDQLIEHGGFVPEDVSMGYHLCYGDRAEEGDERGTHFVEPKDMTKLVEVANAVSAGVTRPIDWIHMPVPINRDDDAYFKPLENLKLHPETELFLGLVHDQDGLDGTQRRIKTAARFVKDFGVGAECGMARRPRGVQRDILQIQRDAVVPS
jgi:hypothetical protein